MSRSMLLLLGAMLLVCTVTSSLGQTPSAHCDSITSPQGIVLKSTIGVRDQLTTSCSFRPPVEITVVAKTDSTNLRLAYAADQIIFNWELDRSQLRVDGGPANGKHKMGAGAIPVDQYVTVRWVVTASKQSVYVDGELRYEDEGDYSQIYRPVTVFAAEGSALTVKSIVVRPLQQGEEVAREEILDCNEAKTREAIANCLSKQLRDSDAALNAAYQARLQQLSAADRRALQLQQRAWMQERDRSCELAGFPEEREQWFQWLQLHTDRMICVTRYTRLRAAELQLPIQNPQIESAVYASPHGQSLDVTRQLQSACDAGSCQVSCGNQLAGDPDFGTVKYCRIAYRCHGQAAQEAQMQEGEHSTLSCPTDVSTSATPATQPPLQGAISVVVATYGGNVDARFKGNATDDVKTFCDGKESCQYQVLVNRLGDPAFGIQKDFSVQWSCGGSEEFSTDAPKEAGFGSVVTLSCRDRSSEQASEPQDNAPDPVETPGEGCTDQQRRLEQCH